MSKEIHHPQQLTHELSLVSSKVKSLCHLPVTVQQQQQQQDKQLDTNPSGQAFWLNAAKAIDWFQPPKLAYGSSSSESSAKPGWFPGGKLNTTYNCLDRHVAAGFGDRACLHYYSPLPAVSAAPTRSMNYSQVLEEVKLLAGVLKHRLGVKKGDRVILYMPMVLEGVIAFMAVGRLGATVAAVFGGFASKELAKRIEDAEPAAILSASCGLEPTRVIDYKEIIDDALRISKKKAPVLMLRRTGVKGHNAPQLNNDHGEFDWQAESDAIKNKGQQVQECEPVDSSHPLYILYTSGTTGMPKGVVRYQGGHAVASRYAMEHTFGMKREDVMFCASDYGWVVSHSFTVYSPLLIGCASVVFEGKPVIPDAGVFWNVVEKFKANCLFTAPTALRAVRREDPEAKLMAKYDLSSLRSLFLAGERSEPAIIKRYQELLTKYAAPGAIVNDNYWSTESGSPITAIQLSSHFPPLAPRPGSAGLPLPGMDLRIVNDEGEPVAPGEMGNIVLGTPLPPSALGTVWRNDKRFQEAYFDRFRGKGDFFDTGDSGVIDEQGYVSVLSRADDLINVAGHRLGTSLLEQVISGHPLIAESVVVGLPDELKGHVPFAFVTRANSQEAQNADPQDLLKAVNAQVRQDIGAIASLGGLVCGAVPKTRSGKGLRRTIKELVENAAEGKWDAPAAYPPTIEDVSVVDKARESINAYFKAKRPKAKL